MSSNETLGDLASQLEERGIALMQHPGEIPPYPYDGIYYYYQDATGRFGRMTERSLIRRLKETGPCQWVKGKPIVDPEILKIQDHNLISWAGPLAGYSAGIHVMEGNRILVTESSKFIEPVKGDWSPAEKVFNGMFRTGELDQTPYLYGYLSVFAKGCKATLEKGVKAARFPGQVLVMAGEPDCGKTFAVGIITKLFGGKSGRPYNFMTGTTSFNSDLLGASILGIDDEHAGNGFLARKQFGSMIKKFAVGEVQWAQQKGKDAICLKPVQRVLVCVNDDPDSLSVLPPFVKGVREKMMLLKASTADWTSEMDSYEAREAFDAAIEASLPAFMHFLLHEFELPADIKGGRFHVETFHHPDLTAILDELSPEAGAINMIDDLFAQNAFRGPESPKEGRPPNSWEGSTQEFEKIIQKHANSWQSERYLRYANSAGTLLGKLAAAFPGRVSSTKVNGFKRWRITPPDRFP